MEKNSYTKFQESGNNLDYLFLGDLNTSLILNNMMKYSGEDTRLKQISEYIKQINDKDPDEVTEQEKSKLFFLTKDVQNSPFEMRNDYEWNSTSGCRHTYRPGKAK